MLGRLYHHPLMTRSALGSGLYCIAAAVMMLVVDTEVLGIHAFIKPLKFGLSSVVLFTTFSWYYQFLPKRLDRAFNRFAWVNTGVMLFELSWIFIQAARGTTSHFNYSTSFEGIMFSLMGLAIAVSTTWTLMLLKWTFAQDFRIHPGQLWALRFGIIYFVLFGYAGFVMGAQGAHTVGAADGGSGLVFLNWSLNHGDLRIPHFFGMHALQILPILSVPFRTRGLSAIVLSLLYGACCLGLLYLALLGKSPVLW